MKHKEQKHHVMLAVASELLQGAPNSNLEKLSNYQLV